MSIASLLHRELPARFPNLPLVLGEAPHPIACFPMPSWTTGQVVIEQSGLELCLELGTLTHGHFDAYLEEADPEAQEQAVVHMALAFLEDLVADRVLLWIAKDGSAGGWCYDFSEKNLGEDRDCFLWSGPYRGQESSV